MINRVTLTPLGFGTAIVTAALFVVSLWLPDGSSGLVDVLWRFLLLLLASLMCVEWYVDSLRKLRASFQTHDGSMTAILGTPRRFQVELGSDFSHNPHTSLRFVPFEQWRLTSDPVQQLRLTPNAEFNIELQPIAAGRNQIGRAFIRIQGLFGLTAWERALPFSEAVEVIPARSLATDRMNGFAPEEQRADFVAGRGFELQRLRDYQFGDSLRNVDWKATARRGQKVVRLFSEENQVEVCLMVDASQYGQIQVDRLTRFNHMLNIASQLAERTLLSGDRVSLCVYGVKTKAKSQMGKSHTHFQTIRRILQETSLDAGPANHLSAYLDVAKSLPRRSLIVFLTHLDHSALNDHLLKTVSLASKKHSALVASIRDVDLDRMVETYAEHWLDPFVALSAVQQRDATRLQINQMRKLGAHVVYSTHDHLADELLHTYQALRSRRAIA